MDPRSKSKYLITSVVITPHWSLISQSDDSNQTISLSSVSTSISQPLISNLLYHLSTSTSHSLRLTRTRQSLSASIPSLQTSKVNWCLLLFFLSISSFPIPSDFFFSLHIHDWGKFSKIAITSHTRWYLSYPKRKLFWCKEWKWGHSTPHALNWGMVGLKPYS